MTKPSNPPTDDEFEAYLDGELSVSVDHALIKNGGFDKGRRAEADLQARIDRSLVELFPTAVAPEQHVSDVTASVAKASSGTTPLLRQPGWWVAAAALAGVLLAWTWNGDGGPETYFEPTPVAQLYRESVRAGFEPYYECEDAERFAQVFSRRQGTPLKLLPMPEGSRMLGISYPGGLSRDTTAMLCRVDGEPVMVFIDRLEADKPVAQAGAGGDSKLQVFRTARNGLVFYEVSPFNQPHATEFLVVDRSAATGA